MKNNYGVIGGFFWLILSFVFWDDGMQQESYLIWLYLAAPMFLSACALRIIGFSLFIQNLSVLLGALQAISFLLPTESLGAIFLVAPWVFISIYLTLAKLAGWSKKKVWDHRLLKVIAPLFMFIGAIWALFHRAGIGPLGFDPTITLLTGVHFHYAGLILMSLASMWLVNFPKKWQRIFPWLFIISIPTLAIGITWTKLYGPNLFETFAASLMAGTALLFALLNIKYLWPKQGRFSKYLIIGANFFLIAGMSLALLFGWKNVLGISWISIPWMYAVHGTINSIGFALPGIIGSSFALREQAV